MLLLKECGEGSGQPRGGKATEQQGERLRRLRGERPLTEAAQAAQISPAALEAYESGRRTPRDEVKRRLAAIYGCSVESVFLEENATNSG